MSRARKVARSASNRAAMRDALALLGPALTGGFVVAGLLVAADRLLGLGLSVWAVTAAPAVIAAGAALAVALARRQGEVGAAARVDQALGLRDRLSSAIALTDDDATREDAFTQWAAEDAERTAERVRIAHAIPVRLDAWWAVWPAVGAGVVFAAVMAPSFDLFGREALRERQAAQAAQREDAGAAISEAAERARETLESARNDAAPAATSEQLRALEELEEQLAAGQLSPDEARSRAAASLEQIAAGAENEAAQLERDLGALEERLDRLDPSLQAAPLGEQMAQALREGDFERAASLLEELQRSVGEGAMSESERHALSEDLERLAQQLESAGEGAPLEQQPTAPASASEPDPQRVEDLQNQGLSEDQAERLASMSDEAALREELTREGVAPDVADRLAEQIAQENLAREATQRAEERTRDLSEALRDAAEDVRDPQSAEEPPAPTPKPPPGAESSPESAPNGERGAPEPRDAPGERPQQTPEGGGEKPGAPPSAPDEPAPAPQSGDRPEQQGQGEQPLTPEGMEAGEQREQSEGAEMQDRPPGESNPGPSGGQEQDPAQPGDGTPQSDQREQQQQDGAAPEGGAAGAERARRALEEMGEERRGAAERREGAQELREEAQRLMEGASPEQREQAQRWAQQTAQEQGQEGVGAGAGATGQGVRTGAAGDERPFGTENVDVRRGSSEQGRVAAEWVDPNAPSPRGGVEGPRTAEGLREAARSADRALEEQSVSPRYNRVVREFFRRRLEALEQRPAPVVPAQDVERAPPAPPAAPAPSASPAPQ